MKLMQFRIKTSLLLMVFSLSLTTFVAIAVGWYSLLQGSTELNAIAASGNQIDSARSAALLNGVNQRYQYASMAFSGLLALTVLLALLAYLTLSRAVLRPLRQVGIYFDHIASGDLTQRIDGTSQTEIGMLYLALKRMQESLGRMVDTVRTGMERINSGSQQIVVGHTDLSSRTEEQATALQQTASSMDQLASTVKQNADNARQANQLAATASEVARKGGQAVSEVVVTMQDISESSRKISDIVGVIDSIAFQTNILALNAAVEAARAGEQGKGFAVVAAEVRALAQRSAQAAKEIKTLIDDSAKKVIEGSGQVERAGATMDEIVVSVARVTDIMGEISAATTEQSSGIDEINHAVARMDGVTQQNAQLVELAASSSTDLREQVAHVTQAVSVFRTADNQVIEVSAVPVAPSNKNSTKLSQPATSVKSISAHQAGERNDTGAGQAVRRIPEPGPAAEKASVSHRLAAPVRQPASSVTRAQSGSASDDEWVEF